MSSRNDCGFSFCFELPSEDLALRGVAIEDGTPKLIFDASMKVPTLTEEDVGIACRLACDEKRPEFFYYGFSSHHPYYGRQYKHYSPEWLKGTSVGELLSEVDWTMKCLNIGARSDKTKERFWAWRETSKLEGLADVLDFPQDKLGGSVIMSCDSVEVEKNENELIFVGEPKMKITDKRNSTYTKYITDIYSSIAYYDEPLFLKMQELIKLTIAAEWMKEKGVRFSRPWMLACSNEKSQAATQAIEVKQKWLGEEKVKDFASKIIKQLPESSNQQVMTVLGPLSVDTVVEKNVTESGFEIKVTQTVLPCSLDAPKVEQTTIMRASVNDYDLLYSGLDPNMPIAVSKHREAIVPNVESWSELFKETVPWPRTWRLPYNGEEIFSTTGGVATSNIPVVESVASKKSVRVKPPARKTVRQGQFETCDKQLRVQANKGYKKDKAKNVSREMVPRSQVVSRPDNNVTSKTEQTLRNQSLRKQGGRQANGTEDPGSGTRVVCDEKGQLIHKQQGMRLRVQQRTITKPINNTPPTSQPLQQQEQQVAPPIDIFSPTGSVASFDSGFVSNPPNPQPLAFGQQQQQIAQPAGATNDLFSPTGSVASNDSGIVSNPPNLQPLPFGQQQIAQPAGDLFSPSGSVISNDSGFSDGQSNHNQQVRNEGEHSKPAGDKDDDASSDSGNDSFEGADN